MFLLLNPHLILSVENNGCLSHSTRLFIKQGTHHKMTHQEEMCWLVLQTNVLYKYCKSAPVKYQAAKLTLLLLLFISLASVSAWCVEALLCIFIYSEWKPWERMCVCVCWLRACHVHNKWPENSERVKILLFYYLYYYVFCRLGSNNIY